jgi:hypothetical protein
MVTYQEVSKHEGLVLSASLQTVRPLLTRVGCKAAITTQSDVRDTGRASLRIGGTRSWSYSARSTRSAERPAHSGSSPRISRISGRRRALGKNLRCVVDAADSLRHGRRGAFLTSRSRLH